MQINTNFIKLSMPPLEPLPPKLFALHIVHDTVHKTAKQIKKFILSELCLPYPASGKFTNAF